MSILLTFFIVINSHFLLIAINTFLCNTQNPKNLLVLYNYRRFVKIFIIINFIIMKICINKNKMALDIIILLYDNDNCYQFN